MSFHILNTGASALTTAQRQVETAAHNTANSTTPGYTRQRVTTTASVPAQGSTGVPGTGHVGTGVQVVAIDRLRDALGDLAVRAEAATAADAGVRAEVFDRAQAALGVYGAGLPEALTAMFDAFDQLSLTPAEPSVRQLVLDAARTFTMGLNSAADGLETLREDMRLQADVEVAEVNTITKEIASLNSHIVAARNAGSSPNDLLDRRDVLLDKLASLVGIDVRSRPEGSVDVTTGGNPLVQGSSSYPLTVTAHDEDYGVVLKLWLNEHPVTVGGTLGARVGVLADPGGTSTSIADLQVKLNTLATAVAGAVNDIHARGHHSPTGTGQDFFGPLTPGTAITAGTIGLADGLNLTTIAAVRIADLDSYDPTQDFSALNGENARLLAGLRKDTVERIGAVASGFGNAAASAMGAAETSSIALRSLQAQRDAKNGVSIDEEMIELVKFQHSYDAAARVISIADEMLNTLINRMGAGR